MAVIEVRVLEPAAELLTQHGISLHRVQIPTYQCESCGCMFMPELDGSQLWPDRYCAVDKNGSGCLVSCTCHDLDYCVPVAHESDN